MTPWITAMRAKNKNHKYKNELKEFENWTILRPQGIDKHVGIDQLLEVIFIHFLSKNISNRAKMS